MKNYQEILIPLAIKAGEEIMKFYGKNYNTEFKLDNSPVTDADIAANEIIVSQLEKTNISIISEESVNMSFKDRF